MGTLIGMNDGGILAKWTAPSSWGCSNYGLEKLYMGTLPKEQLFANMETESQALTWLLRALGFALMWVAFALMFGPLGVVADCIPCIGPMLGDSIETITCCISCLPATACCSLVVGVVW